MKDKKILKVLKKVMVECPNNTVRCIYKNDSRETDCFKCWINCLSFEYWIKKVENEIKEVNRIAEKGEYVKLTIDFTNQRGEKYEKGDVLYIWDRMVMELEPFSSFKCYPMYKKEPFVKLKDGRTIYNVLLPDEYVVLENYKGKAIND